MLDASHTKVLLVLRFSDRPHSHVHKGVRLRSRGHPHVFGGGVHRLRTFLAEPHSLAAPRLSVSAHDSWSSCVRCPMCLFLRPAGVETVVSEIDIIVSST